MTANACLIINAKKAKLCKAGSASSISGPILIKWRIKRPGGEFIDQRSKSQLVFLSDGNGKLLACYKILVIDIND